jgi:hypothetical protein
MNCFDQRRFLKKDTSDKVIRKLLEKSSLLLSPATSIEFSVVDTSRCEKTLV